MRRGGMRNRVRGSGQPAEISARNPGISVRIQRQFVTEAGLGTRYETGVHKLTAIGFHYAQYGLTGSAEACVQRVAGDRIVRRESDARNKGAAGGVHGYTGKLCFARSSADKSGIDQAAAIGAKLTEKSGSIVRAADGVRAPKWSMRHRKVGRERSAHHVGVS